MRDLTCTRTIDLDIITAEKLKKRAHLISFRWRRVRVVMAWKIIKSSKMAIHTLVDLFIFPLWNLTGLKSVGTRDFGTGKDNVTFWKQKVDGKSSRRCSCWHFFNLLFMFKFRKNFKFSNFFSEYFCSDSSLYPFYEY